MQKYMVELDDDIDGSTATESVRFALDGVAYVIDLNEKNAAKLRDSLAPFVTGARKSAVQSTGKQKAKADKEDLGAMRAWLREKGHEVSDRGRIPNSLREEYAAAH